MSTVRSLLDEAAASLQSSGVGGARLDAQLLLAHVLGVARTGILAHPDAPVGDGSVVAFRAIIERRRGGVPVAYLRGIREFHGLAFAVDERVLIPRPETELLVDLAFERVRALLTGAPRPPGAAPVRVWDVGTGSGAIAVALAATLRRRGFLEDVQLIASDVSADALQAAVENVVAHGLADRVQLVQGDLLQIPDASPVELLVANLPYVATGDIPSLAPEVRAEPSLALDGGPDGLALIRRLLAGLPGVVRPGGAALLEIGADQGAALRDLATRLLPGWGTTLHEDLAGLPRVVALEPGGATQPAGLPA